MVWGENPATFRKSEKTLKRAVLSQCDWQINKSSVPRAPCGRSSRLSDEVRAGRDCALGSHSCPRSAADTWRKGAERGSLELAFACRHMWE